MSDGGFWVDIDVDDADVWAMLARLQRAVSAENLTITLQGGVVQFLQERMEARFAGQGDEAVGAWAELDPDTLAFKEREGAAGRSANIRTGALYEWITHADGDMVYAGDTLLLEWPGEPPESEEIADKLMHLQFGSEDPAAPARPLIGASEVDMQGVMEILVQHMYLEMGAGLR